MESRNTFLLFTDLLADFLAGLVADFAFFFVTVFSLSESASSALRFVVPFLGAKKFVIVCSAAGMFVG